MKVKELSLLIVDEDQTLRQLLAAIVSDRYRSVTTAAPEEVGSLLVVESLLLQVAIENSEFSLRQLKRIEENDIVY
ncbi:MAG TPA: hypothetical protein VGJ48_06370 [Pyrinomonadaceae bacterium]